MVAASVKYALSIALLPGADAFLTPITRTFNAPSSQTSTLPPAWIAESIRNSSNSNLVLSSSKKEVGYDEKTGQLQGDRDECIPDDEYCVLDEKSGNLIRLTLAEKERIFLDALQSYYVNSRQLLPDDQFDLLKEDLSWNGSKLVQMNRNEAKYLAAMESFTKGTPMLSDEEFDSLKATLKEEKSQFAVSTEPKCYIDTGICTVTLKEDNFRRNLLYLPVGLTLSLLWLGFGFEILSVFVRINPVLLILLGSYGIYKGTKFITDGYIFTDNKIVYGPCPSCEAENRVFFGDILGVEGFSDIASLKCPNCKVKFDVQRNSMRASTLPPK